MEIERKWVFEDLSIVNKYPIIKTKDYAQGYLSVDPEVRVSWSHTLGSEEVTYKLTIKSKGDLTRIEIEKNLTADEFNQLLKVGRFTHEDLITKFIYFLDINGHTLTIGSVDEDTPQHFYYGEIEFENEEAAMAFVAPPEFGREVTYESGYKMANYWACTRLWDGE